ncbi:hypothetical protein PR202_gb15033 [Eleusine coracana subsp. coracana]|uniref:Uncharacterized protein n=1 Tax=Eleusine coracana subsp. coracana TaxID=191504 RepID=A0AAV5EWK5_ELECO|nr:hypothetical protein PR202_gb15033 [Eleusine coracana subsp. coracana]
MGFYNLHKTTYKKMDTIRSNFFWQGAEKKFKYHMVKWEAVTTPKEFGGLETKGIWGIGDPKHQDHE